MKIFFDRPYKQLTLVKSKAFKLVINNKKTLVIQQLGSMPVLEEAMTS